MYQVSLHPFLHFTTCLRPSLYIQDRLACLVFPTTFPPPSDGQKLCLVTVTSLRTSSFSRLLDNVWDRRRRSRRPVAAAPFIPCTILSSIAIKCTTLLCVLPTFLYTAGP
ncbi:hypothetical protein AB1N83_011183 [Pleurotus pulmonarius]